MINQLINYIIINCVKYICVSVLQIPNIEIKIIYQDCLKIIIISREI